MKLAVTIPPNSPDTAHLAQWAKCLLLGRGEMRAHIDHAERLKMPDRVIRVMKAPLQPVLTTDGSVDGYADAKIIATTFLPLLRNASIFARLLEAGMVRVPLRQRITIMTGSATGRVRSEGNVIVVSRPGSAKYFLEPKSAAGIAIFSNEFVNGLTDGGEATLSSTLRDAIAVSADAQFLDDAEDGLTPVYVSTGSTADAAAADLKRMVDAVAPTAQSRLLWAMAPDVGRAASTLMSGDSFMFPEMSPTGGSMINVPAMVADSMAEGTIGLFDAAGFAGEMESINLRHAKHATVQMDSNPDSPPTASTTLVNLWQADLHGLLTEAYFGSQRLRDSAFAKTTGVTWGTYDSP